jgi:WD40 repeat protein
MLLQTAGVQNSNLQVGSNLNYSNNEGGSNLLMNTTSSNNNYQNLMMDSLLLRSNSESFSVDRGNFKNSDGQRERVLSFNSVINTSNNNILNKTSKTPKSFLNQIKNLAENKSLIDPCPKYSSISTRLKEISSQPERILDAPNLVDDYYLNLIDWSSSNLLAVALGNSVYLWNGNTSETMQLMTSTENICSVNWINSGNCLAVGLNNGHIELWDSNKFQQIRDMTGHSDRVCSLSWNNYILSSGSKDAKIINHDVRVRNHIFQNLIGHTQEVCSLKWSPDGSLLASGGNDNLLCIWDINYVNQSSHNYNHNNLQQGRSRSFSANVNLLNNQVQSRGSIIQNNFNNGNYNSANSYSNFLLTNSNFNNNNLIQNITNNLPSNRPSAIMPSSSSIWNIIEENDDMGERPISNQNNNNFISQPIESSSHSTQPLVNTIQPKYVFTQHEAAVKALAWCPWQKGLLASGAGSKDKTIKFWNVDSGSLINSVDSGSQVCALLWSKHEKELISSHGYSKNQISLWKYPSMYKITELNGHMSRVLYMAMSPDGCSLVSGAGDETLRFWKIHENKKTTSDSMDYKMMNSFQLR